MRLPGDWKMDPSRPKPLLLDTLSELIPDDVWRRPKMGFTLPFRKWMGSVLQPEIDAVLGRSGGIGGAGIRRDAAGAVWQRFQKTPERERWSRPWSLYVLHKWCEANGVMA
jgi:asparagine synthase (glutamine-hydrolysing)